MREKSGNSTICVEIKQCMNDFSFSNKITMHLDSSFDSEGIFYQSFQLSYLKGMILREFLKRMSMTF